MGYKISVAVEVLNRRQLTAFTQELADLINAQPAATTKISIMHEVTTIRGKRKVTDTIEIAPGEQVALDDFGGMVSDTPIENFLKEMDGGQVEFIAPGRSDYE